MKSTKRLLCLLLCAVMVLSLLAACGGQGEESQPTANTTEATTVPETTVPETTAAPTEPPQTNLTVGEFEERLNTLLKAADIPLEYDFFEWHEYGRFYNRVTYTGPDNPFITNNYGYEYDATAEYFSFGDVIAVHSDDTDQSAIICFTISTDYRDETDPQVALFNQLIPVILSVCDDQITDEELDMFIAAEFVKGESSTGDEFYEKVFQNDVIRCRISEQFVCHNFSDGSKEWYEQLRVDVEFLNVSSADRNIPTGEELLDPKYLDFVFDIHQPMVTDGMFNIHVSYTRQFDGSTGEFAFFEVLDDYYSGTKTPLWHSYGEYWYTSSAEYIGFGSDWELDPSVFFISWFWDTPQVMMCYSTSPEHFEGYYGAEPEYMIRAAIGLSMLFDEGMTAEEAVQLHTHAMESTTTEDGWQITYYCPRDVMHIVQVNPATEENTYLLMTREYFEMTYGPVEEYLP